MQVKPEKPTDVKVSEALQLEAAFAEGMCHAM
jgi:hypothetical protein